MKLLKAELLKYKRTFMAKLIIFIPVFFAVYAIVIGCIMSQNPQTGTDQTAVMSWSIFLALVFNWWSFLFLPLGMGLFAGLAASQERKAGNYRALRSHDISPVKLWIAKAAGMAVISFLSAITLILVVAITGWMTIPGNIPFGTILTGSLLCWLTTLALIPLQLWIASWGGMIFSFGAGFAGTIAGVLLAPTDNWIYCPWSWATRIMCPVIGVHPNGVLLETANPFLSGSVLLPGIVVSILVCVAILLLTGFWFDRREVK